MIIENKFKIGQIVLFNIGDKDPHTGEIFIIRKNRDFIIYEIYEKSTQRCYLVLDEHVIESAKEQRLKFKVGDEVWYLLHDEDEPYAFIKDEVEHVTIDTLYPYELKNRAGCFQEEKLFKTKQEAKDFFNKLIGDAEE